MEMLLWAFHWEAMRPKLPGCRRHAVMTPEPSPTVQQLLAFYLEAGVDCALADEPVDRLAEPDSVTMAASAAPVREVAPPRQLRETPSAMPAVSRSEIAPAPETAIASA